MKGLVVIARSKGPEARWTGASNGDGIAEIALELEGLAFGDPLDLEVRAEGEPKPLAQGRVEWREVAGDGKGSGLGGNAGSLGGERRVEPGGAARPTVRSGAIGLDVVIEGDRLIAGFPTSLWVRATPPPGISPSGLTIAIDPEPGLVTDRPTTTTCGAGWAEVPVTALAHVVGAGVEVHAPSRGEGAEAPAGKWFGALPVAPGAFFVSMPRVLPAGAPATVVLIAPNPREVVYAELDDTRGRVAAAALKVAVEPGDPTPRARFELPPLVQLGADDLAFVTAFVRSSGSLKAMASQLGISYPTVRNRLDEILARLAELERGVEKRRHAILDALEHGRLTAQAAAEELRKVGL